MAFSMACSSRRTAPPLWPTLAGCGCAWRWLLRRACAALGTCCAPGRWAASPRPAHSAHKNLPTCPVINRAHSSLPYCIISHACSSLSCCAESSTRVSALQADLTLKLKGVDPGAPPAWDEGTHCNLVHRLPTLLRTNARRWLAGCSRRFACPTIARAALPHPPSGLPEEVEGAQLQRKLENDVHCDYQRPSWSALYHRALGLNPAFLHRLRSEQQLASAPGRLSLLLGGWELRQGPGAGACSKGSPHVACRPAPPPTWPLPQPADPCPTARADVKDYFPSLPAQLRLDRNFELPPRLNHFQSKTCELDTSMAQPNVQAARQVQEACA